MEEKRGPVIAGDEGITIALPKRKPPKNLASQRDDVAWPSRSPRRDPNDERPLDNGSGAVAEK